jgi:hypothetical protein
LLPCLHNLLGSWCLFPLQRSSSCLMSNAKVAHLLWLSPWSSNFIKVLCMFDIICCNRCMPHNNLKKFQNNYSLLAALEWNCFILKMSTLKTSFKQTFAIWVEHGIRCWQNVTLWEYFKKDILLEIVAEVTGNTKVIWWVFKMVVARVSGLLRVSLNVLNSMNGEVVGKKLCKLSYDVDNVKRCVHWYLLVDILMELMKEQW